MKRFRLLGLALLAVLALGAVMSASAFALPELLPVKAGGSQFKGKSDGANLSFESASKEKLECTAAPMEGAQTNDTSGTFHFTLTGCKAQPLGVQCNSLGDAAGSILVLGAFDQVFDVLSPLGEAVLLLFETIHLECTSLVLLRLTGELVCLWLEGLTSKVSHLFHCNQTSGVQEDQTWFNDVGTAVTANLKTSKNGGTPEAGGLLALFEVTFEEAVAFMND